MNEQHMTEDELGDEITTLAAHIHAATCRWLTLVGEFDARDAWASWGCKSCAHWISWRCAIAPGAAREHVRVARRLRDMPVVREAFAAGELSFSKVRALTRVENIENEQSLLDLAQHSTAAQLEKVVRSYRGVALPEAQRSHEQRYLHVSYTDDGSVLLRGRLPADEGALVMKALEHLRDREHDAARARRDVPAETPGADPPVASGVPAETPAADPPVASDVPAETTPPDWRSAPVDVAASVEEPTYEQRTADALVLLAEEALGAASDAAGRSGGDRFQVVVHVDAAALGGDEGGRAQIADGGALAGETARRLCCDAAVVALTERDGETLSVGRKTRSIPPALRRALRSRDAGCRFPGCQQHRWVDAHHIEHWANGGETSLDNLVELCRHHHRLLHEGGFTVERRADRGLVFRRPDGRRLRDVPHPRRGNPGCLASENRRRGHAIAADTCVPHWWGDRLDLSAAVDAVISAAPLPPDPREHPTVLELT